MDLLFNETRLMLFLVKVAEVNLALDGAELHSCKGFTRVSCYTKCKQNKKKCLQSHHIAGLKISFVKKLQFI